MDGVAESVFGGEVTTRIAVVREESDVIGEAAEACAEVHSALRFDMEVDEKAIIGSEGEDFENGLDFGRDENQGFDAVFAPAGMEGGEIIPTEMEPLTE